MNQQPTLTVAYYEDQIKDEIERKEAEAADLAVPVPIAFYKAPAPAPEEE